MMEAGTRKAPRPSSNTVDITKVKDPRACINSAINEINAGKADEAIALLTKLIAQFPTESRSSTTAAAPTSSPPSCRRRRRTSRSSSPAAADSPQAADAKRLLEQLNKK